MAVKIEGVAAETPAAADEGVATAVEDLTGESDDRVSPEVESEGVDAVDESGISWKNRALQMERMVGNLQTDRKTLLGSVGDLKQQVDALSVKAPAAAGNEDEDDEIFDDAGFGPEVRRAMDRRWGGTSAPAAMAPAAVAAGDTVAIDRSNSSEMRRLVDTVKGYKYAKPFLLEAEQVLRDTDPATRAQEDAPSRALREVMNRNFDAIEEAKARQATEDAQVEKTILGASPTNTSHSLPGGDSMGVAEGTDIALEYLKGKGRALKVSEEDIAKCADKRRGRDDDSKHVLHRKRRG